MSLLCSIQTAAASEQGDITVTGWKYIPKETAVPKDGYFGDTATAQKTFEALKTTRLERDAWRNTVLVISADIEAVRGDAKAQLKTLNDSIKNERKAAERKTFLFFIVGAVAGIVIGSN